MSVSKMKQARAWCARQFAKRRNEHVHASFLAREILEEADAKFGLGSDGVEGWSSRSGETGVQYLNFGGHVRRDDRRALGPLERELLLRWRRMGGLRSVGTMSQQPPPKPPHPPRAPVEWLGDAIRRVTDKLGIPHCQKCDERRETLNRWAPNPFIKKRGR